MRDGEAPGAAGRSDRVGAHFAKGRTDRWSGCCECCCDGACWKIEDCGSAAGHLTLYIEPVNGKLRFAARGLTGPD